MERCRREAHRGQAAPPVGYRLFQRKLKRPSVFDEPTETGSGDGKRGQGTISELGCWRSASRIHPGRLGKSRQGLSRSVSSPGPRRGDHSAVRIGSRSTMATTKLPRYPTPTTVPPRRWRRGICRETPALPNSTPNDSKSSERARACSPSHWTGQRSRSLPQKSLAIAKPPFVPPSVPERGFPWSPPSQRHSGIHGKLPV
jgi:hypothetical protein